MDVRARRHSRPQVIVAGAGLAGLSAARALERRGAGVRVIDARERVGGRVWTIRDGLDAGQHAEGGADLIEAEQTAVVELAADLGLRAVRILRRGFAYYGPDRRGRPAIQRQDALFRHLADALATEIHDYRVAEERWDGAVAARLGRISVQSWLDATGAAAWTRHRARALRGFFLADPEELSLLSLVDVLSGDTLAPRGTMRIEGGNDRLATEAARRLRSPVILGAVLRRVGHHGAGVSVTIESAGRRAELSADALVCALPPTTLAAVVFEPALDERRHAAIARLPFGRATRVLLQFDRRFWRRTARPRAFGSPFRFGAVWEGNEEQRGPAGVLSLLAGGGASAELQRAIARDGTEGLVDDLRWLGRPARLIGSRAIVWDDDPWARGGYAVFGPAYDPAWRDVLARPAGRVFFAGEHTSVRWQGYMNGAVESGLRAAAEVQAVLTRSAPT
jgi:monoamine oxidase